MRKTKISTQAFSLEKLLKMLPALRKHGHAVFAVNGNNAFKSTDAKRILLNETKFCLKLSLINKGCVPLR